jgi:hypothetical protein
MNKYIIIAMAFFCGSASAAHDNDYYRLHPKKLQNVLQTCAEKQSSAINCEQLKTIALSINESAYQLRLDPQGYGKKILLLQQTIAQQESLLNEQSNQSGLQSTLNENKRQLQQHLAIVKWLESPEG